MNRNIGEITKGDTQSNLQFKLDELRKLWKSQPKNRKIIELQARAVIRALEIKKVWKNSGSVQGKLKTVEVIKELF